MADSFDPDAYLGAAPAPAFDPDAFLGAKPAAASTAPSTLSRLASPITDIPKEIFKASKSGTEGAMHYLNPFSEERKGYNERGEIVQPFLDTGKGVLSALSVPASPFIGAARSLLGHPMAAMIPTRTPEEQAKMRAAGVSPDFIPGATPEENYEQAKGHVDTAMSALAPKGAPVKVAPPPGLVRGPYEIPATAPAYQWSLNPKGTPIAPTPNGPLGVTLSEGQATGELPLIQKEQTALRGQAGEAAHARAQEFANQQKGEVTNATERVARGFDPLNQMVAESPQQAGDIVSNALSKTEALKRQYLQQEAEALRPTATMHPLDAADMVSGALRNSSEVRNVARANTERGLATEHEAIRSELSPDNNVLARSPQEASDIVSGAVTRAEEQARLARDEAYDTFREQPGQFNPTAFRGVGNAIRRSLNTGDDPVILNGKVTPMAVGALQDLERTLQSSARTALSPDTPSYRPFTPSLIDDMRKRLLSFQRQASSSARATGDFSDVRAMGRVTDAFDDVVQRSLRNPAQFSGDGQAVADALAQARGLHSELRNTFTKQGGGDKVGPIMQQIVGQREGQAAPANQISQWLYGTGQTPVLVANRMLRLFGEGSQEVSALKQGLFSHITERPEGVTAWGPEQVANRIYDFVGGKGRTLTHTYFSPEEIGRLTDYANQLRQSVPPPMAQTDVVARAVQRVVGEGGQGATPAELADTLFGRAGHGENPMGVKIAQHIRDTQGADSDAFRAIRQGMFSRLTRSDLGRLGEDPAAIAKQTREFLNGRGRPMAETLFSEAERRRLGNYADALDAHAERSAAPKSEVDRAIAKITGRDGEPATGREVADLLYSRSVARDRSLSVNLAKRLKDEFGETSPQWTAVKQGLFHQLADAGEGMTAFGPGKIAQRINKFMNVDGVELANQVFSPAERALIEQYAALHRKLEVPQAGANWSGSGTALAPILKKVSGGISALVGAVLGHTIAPGLYGVGEGVGAAGAAKVSSMFSEARQMRQITRQMPLVAEQLQRWQRAAAIANRQNTPLTQRTMNLASANLAQSLQNIGLNPIALMRQTQGPASSRADQQQQ